MGARVFDGVDDKITITQNPSVNDLVAMSVGFWFKSTPVGQEMIVTKGYGVGGWGVYVYDSGAYQLARDYATTDGNWYSNNFYTAGTSASVVITQAGDLTDAIFYQNGSVLTFDGTSTSPVGTLVADAANNILIASNVVPDFGLLTEFSNLAIWSAVLTAAEAATYNAGGDLPRRESLVGFWRLASGQSPEPDERNGNNGVLAGTTFSAAGPSVSYNNINAYSNAFQSMKVSG